MRVLLGFFVFLSAVSPEFYLGSNKSIEVEWEAWEGRLGVLVRNLRTMMVIH